MQTKLLEIRDAGTFIPALAIRLESESEAERYLLSRAGFGKWNDQHQTYVILIHLQTMRAHYDQYSFGGARTMGTALMYVRENWAQIVSGQVVCVETILGERDTPKVSEREMVLPCAME